MMWEGLFLFLQMCRCNNYVDGDRWDIITEAFGEYLQSENWNNI